MSKDAVCEQLYALIQSVPGGATNEHLNKMPDVPAAQRLEALNKLLQQGNVEVLKKGEQLIYRAKDAKTNSALANTDNEEKIVHAIIESGGQKGIWIRDIRFKSNLNMTQLNKILKNLENKKLIKAVKSINASKKKVYMLYDLQPDRTVTGGAWYQDQDFEAEFVDVLSMQCLRFLQMKRDEAEKCNEGPLIAKKLSCASVGEVHKYIANLGISKVNLDEDDLETILNTVMYDGLAESILQMDGTYLYRAINSALPTPGFVQTPCGTCPLMKDCSKTSDINPITCDYLNIWLD